MNSSPYSDEELLFLLSKADTKAMGFNLLVRQYREALYWFIRKMLLSHEDSDDVLQDSLIKVYNKIDDFRGESKLSTWMYQIAYHGSLDFLKKKRKKFIVPLESVSEVLKNNLKSDAYFDGDAIEARLQEAIAELPGRQREVFILVYYEDLSYKEVAEILDLSEGSIKTNMHLARKKIELFLDKD